MARFIQRRDGVDGPRYREWSTIVDQYLTPPITRDEMREKLLHAAPGDGGGDAAAVDVRLARVDERGTSRLFGDPEPLDGPWDTERCDERGGFHHTFDLRELSDKCASCGEPCEDRSHGPACEGE